MHDEDYEPDWSEGEDMESTEQAGDGVTVQINRGAMERIEAAAAHGVRQELAKRLDKVIHDTIADIVEAKLNEVVGSLAEKVILDYLTKPRPRTNHYGETIGGNGITIADQIPDKVEKYLTERVQNDGSRTSYNDSKYPTRLDWLVGKYVRDELTVATKKAADQVTEQAKKVVASHVGRFVAEQMIPQIEVSKNGATFP